MSRYAVWTQGLTPEMKEKAELELGETPEMMKKALEELRQVISGHSDFHPWLDESFLLRFLRNKKYDVKRAHKTLKNYYAYKAKYSGHITDITPHYTERIYLMNKLLIMPTMDLHRGMILVCSVGQIDLEAVSAEEMFSAAVCAVEVALWCESVQVCGLSVVWDFKGITLVNLLRIIRPTFMATLLRALMDTWPIRVKSLHVVNEPYQFNFLYNTICYPILSKKLRERVFLHGENVSTLHSVLPRECLPEFLGGGMRVGPDEFRAFAQEVAKRQLLSERLAIYKFKGKMYPAKLRTRWTDGVAA